MKAKRLSGQTRFAPFRRLNGREVGWEGTPSVDESGHRFRLQPLRAAEIGKRPVCPQILSQILPPRFFPAHVALGVGVDAWGNLTNRAAAPGMGSNCATEPLNDAPATTQNQLTGITYDAAGNVTNDGIGNQPTYDAENRIATESGVTYYYDADGARMEKSSGTKYWFGPAGVVLTETGLTGTINEEYVYFNGERIARIDRPSGTVHYYFSNHLGSASVITSATGTIQEQMDFYPFGGVAYTSGSDTNHFKFTGKERDSESGFDNFGARYFESNVGRFMTPDWAARPTAVPYAVFGDPQSLNLYIYVRNDPVTRADADGHQDPPLSPITPDSANSECRYEHCNDTPQAQNNASTVPIVLPAPPGPIVLPALGEAAKDLVGGIIETLAVPFIIADYLISPSYPVGRDSTDQPLPPSTSQQGAVDTTTMESRRPSADVRRRADEAATGADGKLHCAYCGRELTTESGRSNSREFDHVNPYSQSRDSSAGNIKDACRTCNRQKGGRTPEEWGGPQQ